MKEDDNKITIFRRTHVALNNLFWDKQNPKEQLRMMFGIWDTALSENVREQLCNILNLPDELFYNETLLKDGKKKRKKTKDTWFQWDSDRGEILKTDCDWDKEMKSVSQ